MSDESRLPVLLRKKLPIQLENIKKGHYTSNDYDYPIHKYLQDRDIIVEENGSEIVNFLKGKSILITGATGFLGKLLVEKLLRSCKDIEKIYLIIRTKKGKDTETRIKEYLDNLVFHKLSEIRPNFREKVVGINGDLEQFGLDLTKESRKLITDNVNIIYHVGATVRFDEKIRPSAMINVNAVREIVKLAKECKKFDVLCHVSTAFSNCTNKYIRSVFYEPYVESNELLYLVENLSDKSLEKLSTGLIGDVPNSYVFTKQIGEDIVRREAIGIPTCIQRPAIVIPTYKEPLPSWNDNIIGIGGLIHSVALGLTHIIPGKSDANANLVPADYVINHCIAVSYKTAKDKITDKIPIYNYAAPPKNALTWKALVSKAAVQGYKIGSTKVVSKHFATFTESTVVFLFLNFLFHYLPVCLADWGLILTGKKPIFINIYGKVTKFIEVLRYFIVNEWTFDMTTTDNLWHSLNDIDKKNFAFDMNSVNWTEYFETFLVGLREFVLKEYLDNLDQGRAHYNKVVFFSYGVITTITLLSIYFLINTIFCFIPLTIISIILYYWLC